MASHQLPSVGLASKRFVHGSALKLVNGFLPRRVMRNNCTSSFLYLCPTDPFEKTDFLNASKKILIGLSPKYFKKYSFHSVSDKRRLQTCWQVNEVNIML